VQGLKTELLAYGHSIKLDLIGIAPAHPFLQEKERLNQRKAAGLGPNPFEHQEIEPRAHPEQLLPGVKSIIAAGISYHVDEPDTGLEAETEPPRGWLSRYCRGQDYHHVLRGRLEQLADWLEARVPGARTMVHVDTGPPLDRAVAERAGIGKWGKHTNLITHEYGTWIFLGEILTDVELPPDQPIEAACGSCTLCLDACPTQCLTEWQIDGNRCLSYVTQMKGIIPVEYREVMGNRLFGCDDCQDVCPYNRKVKTNLHPEFSPVPEIGAQPDLLKMMTMSKSEFKRWFVPTAAGWRGKTTIQRNALIALANSGHGKALAPLTQALGNESAVIRATAAWGLGRLARQAPATANSARQALAQIQITERHPSVLLELNNALEVLTRDQSPAN